MAQIEIWHDDLLRRLRQRRGGPTGRAKYSPRRPRRKDRTAVVTDSSAALPRIVLDHPLATGLRQVPMPVMIGEQIHAEGTAELDRDLPIALATGSTVRTSRPAPGAFTGVYQQIAEAGFARILSIHLSGKLSGTADAARIAAREALIPVTVVDSETTGFCQGTVVLDALIRAGFHEPIEDIAAGAHRAAAASRVFFTVPNLEQLRRGGRIGTLTGIIGSLLQVKPVLSLEDGVVTLVDRPRSTPKAIDRMVELIAAEAQAAQTPVRLAVHVFGNDAVGHELAERLQDLSATPVPVIPLPAVLAAHLGLGGLGITLNPVDPDALDLFH